MNKVDVYNTEYTNLNHSYILIYNAYKKLLECEDADPEVVYVIENILRAMNPALDKIKSEMTVKTRIKESGGAAQEKTSGTGKDGYILTGNFGSD